MENCQKPLILFGDNRRLTRLQARCHRDIFYFLGIPAELRNIIYDLSLGSLEDIETFFKKHYKTLISKRVREPPRPLMRTPSILLLNKQIYREAFGLYRSRKAVFSHGLLKIRDVKEIVSPNVLRQVSSVEINDTGHSILKRQILGESWHGYLRLLRQLADILAQGHNLQNFTVEFSDRRLEEHMKDCWHAEHECSYRDGLRDVAYALRHIRGVGLVTIRGLNPQQALALKQRMESTSVNFLSLPREIRDLIYKGALDWSTVSQSLLRAMADWPDKRKPFPYPPLSTPGILLASRQTSSEAQEVLRNKPLTWSLSADHSLTEEHQIPSLLRFTPQNMLQHVRTLHIQMESWEWMFAVDRPFCVALAASPNLRSLHIKFRDGLKPCFLSAPNLRYPDSKLHARFKHLTLIRGLREAVFVGDLPTCYTDALLQIMTTTALTEDQLPKPKAIMGDGLLVDVDEGDDSEAA